MATKKIVAKGAEAVLIRKGDHIIKRRISKGYRHPQLDRWMTIRRTRREAKILDKVSKTINSPKIIRSDEENAELTMEFVDGKILSDCLDNLPRSDALKTCFDIGSEVGLLHEMDIIHGDLTTSNMILNRNKISLIDFGLGFHSARAEDKAVDLKLLKEAMKSKHYKNGEADFNQVLKGYKVTSKEEKKVFEQLKKVEGRGRYKGKKKENY